MQSIVREASCHQVISSFLSIVNVATNGRTDNILTLEQCLRSRGYLIKRIDKSDIYIYIIILQI